MPKITYLLIFFSIIAFFTLMAALMMFRSMFVATKGRRIAVYPNPQKALVVLDIQEGYSGTEARRPVTAPPATAGLQQQSVCVAAWRKAGWKGDH